MATHVCPDSGSFATNNKEINKMENTYTITRLETWDDETWAEVIEAIEATIESFGDN